LVIQERTKFEEETKPNSAAISNTALATAGPLPTVAVVSIVAALQNVRSDGKTGPYVSYLSREKGMKSGGVTSPITKLLKDFGRFGDALRGEVDHHRGGADTVDVRTINGVRTVLQTLAEDSQRQQGNNVVAVRDSQASCCFVD
jgi:hypothetical protein